MTFVVNNAFLRLVSLVTMYINSIKDENKNQVLRPEPQRELELETGNY